MKVELIRNDEKIELLIEGEENDIEKLFIPSFDKQAKSFNYSQTFFVMEWRAKESERKRQLDLSFEKYEKLSPQEKLDLSVPVCNAFNSLLDSEIKAKFKNFTAAKSKAETIRRLILRNVHEIIIYGLTMHLHEKYQVDQYVLDGLKKMPLLAFMALIKYGQHLNMISVKNGLMADLILAANKGGMGSIINIRLENMQGNTDDSLALEEAFSKVNCQGPLHKHTHKPTKINIVSQLVTNANINTLSQTEFPPSPQFESSLKHQSPAKKRKPNKSKEGLIAPIFQSIIGSSPLVSSTSETSYESPSAFSSVEMSQQAHLEHEEELWAEFLTEIKNKVNPMSAKFWEISQNYPEFEADRVKNIIQFLAKINSNVSVNEELKNSIIEFVTNLSALKNMASTLVPIDYLARCNVFSWLEALQFNFTTILPLQTPEENFFSFQ